MTGSTVGFMFSCIFMEPVNGIVLMNIFLFVLYFSSGIFANFASGSNIILDYFTPLSPFTYVCEEMMRSLLDGLPYANNLYDYFHFDKGSQVCIESTLKIVLSYFVVAWVFTFVKSKIMF